MTSLKASSVEIVAATRKKAIMTMSLSGTWEALLPINHLRERFYLNVLVIRLCSKRCLPGNSYTVAYSILSPSDHVIRFRLPITWRNSCTTLSWDDRCRTIASTKVQTASPAFKQSSSLLNGLFDSSESSNSLNAEILAGSFSPHSTRLSYFRMGSSPLLTNNWCRELHRPKKWRKKRIQERVLSRIFTASYISDWQKAQSV